MTLDPSDLLQLLMGILLGVIGFLTRQTLDRLKMLEEGQKVNSGRLIRIETKLGIPEGVNHHEA